jgi:hypothetical protein
MGIGFAGGEWRGGVFAYNTAVVHVDERFVHTTFVDRTIVERNTIVNNNHVAFSGGPGGINHPPTAEERIAEHEQHVQPTSFQRQHIQTAQSDKMSYAKANGGRPANLAVARPLQAESHSAPTASRGSEISASGRGQSAINNNSSKSNSGNFAGHTGAQTSASGAGRVNTETYNPSHANTVHNTATPRTPPQERPSAQPRTPPQERPAPAPKSNPKGHEK